MNNKCTKPGCGAYKVIGRTCTDKDCPQEWVHHTVYNMEIATKDAEIARLQAENERMREALDECEEYFDNRADAEYFSDSPQPVANEEMHLLGVVRSALPAIDPAGGQPVGVE